jgi:hypothetical protein
MYGTIRSGNIRLSVGTLVWRFQSALRNFTVSTPLTNINDQFSYVLRVPCETEVGALVASSNALRLISVATTYDRATVTLITDATNALAFASPALTNFAMASRDRGRVERVDLLANWSFTDLDGNTLADFWEKQYFGRIGMDPNDDYDQDGMSNYAEFKAGTNPTDPNSRFAFVNAVAEPPGIRVEWSAVEGTMYKLMRSADLLTGFTNLVTHIQATAPKNSHHDTTATGAGPYFYRVAVEE